MDELITERLLLRPCMPDDADVVFEAERESLDELRPWFWWCHPVHDPARSRRWAESRPAAWAKGEEYAFLGFARCDGTFVGCAWINAIDKQSLRGSLGYWIRSRRARQGFAVEATREVVRFGFDRLALRRIEIVAAVDNRASQRVAEKLGATLEGTARRRLLVNGINQDAHIYSLISAS